MRWGRFLEAPLFRLDQTMPALAAFENVMSEMGQVLHKGRQVHKRLAFGPPRPRGFFRRASALLRSIDHGDLSNQAGTQPLAAGRALEA
jgi:hypothetical protein